MSRPPIPAEAFDHGDPKRYRRGCHCSKCVTGASRESRKNGYLRATGRGALCPATRAAQHIQQLRAAGMDDFGIMAAATISPDVLYRIVRAERPIRRTTEQRIISVAIPEKTGPTLSRTTVDALGTRRRLQALVAAGWTYPAIALRLGRDKQNVLQVLSARSRVTLRLVDEIRAVYAELAPLVPEEHGVAPVHAFRARKLAARKGWAGPGYWDDETFDDPDFVPVITEPKLSRDELAERRREEVEHLAFCGLTSEQISERVDLSIGAIRQLVLEWRRGYKRDRTPAVAA